jgi:hypothetical protein
MPSRMSVQGGLLCGLKLQGGKIFLVCSAGNSEKLYAHNIVVLIEIQYDAWSNFFGLNDSLFI